MGGAKIEIKVGEVSFAAEGNEKWLSVQLDKVLRQLPDLAGAAPTSPSRDRRREGTQAGGRKAPGTLAAFLVAKKATRNKTRAFLAAALWLQDRGKERLSTGDVSRALYENKQGKLANASQRLAHNVKRGLCAKVGRREFYVTEEGRAELG
jgi:hypothetical protein